MVNKNPAPIGQRIVSSGLWVGGRFGLTQLMGFTHAIFVARMLPPKEIGLLGIAMLMIIISRSLTQTGMEQSLIRSAEIDDRDLGSAWTVAVLRGSLLSLILFAISGWTGPFFGEQDVAPLLRVLALVPVIEGFASASMVVLRREMGFKRLFFVQVGAQAVELFGTVVMVLLWRSIWAVVYARLVGMAAMVIASYLVHPYRARLLLDRATLKRHYAYGKWVTLSSIMVVILVNGDDFLVGKLYNAADLAYYQMAFKLSNYPAIGLSSVVATVMFPAYATVQDEPGRLADLFQRTLRITALIAMPAAILIYALRSELVLAILGDKWDEAIPLVQILTLFGLSRALGSTTGPLFLATGRSRLRAQFQSGQLLLFVVLAYPLSQLYGVAGIAMAATAHSATAILAVMLCLHLCNVPMRRGLTPVIQTVLASIVAAMILRPIQAGLDDHSLPGFIGLTLLGLTLYAALLWIIDSLGGRRFRKELTDIARVQVVFKRSS